MKVRNKRIIVFAWVVTLLFSVLCFPVTAFDTETYDFANFTETDSMAFVEQCGITIPENILASGKSASFTHSLVLRSYEHPNTPFCFNYYETQDYAEAIRAAVRSHMNLGSLPAPATEVIDRLVYNEVQDEAGNWVSSGGYWNPKWLNYNCYAYAINRAEQPGFYLPEDDHTSQSTRIQYIPGAMNDEGLRWGGNLPEDIASLAEVVKADLRAMGYDVGISQEFQVPNATQEVICVRRNSTIDYHFMRYDLETNAWYHKPSDTAILKYGETPSNDSTWYVEFSKYGMEFREDASDGDFLYNSDIRFITYSKKQINVGSTEATSSVSIQPGKDVFYELTFEVSGLYDIQLTATYPFMFDIYSEDFTDEDDDENGNVYGEDNDNSILSNSNSGNFNQSIWFEAGKYYLRMNFISDSLDAPCNIDVSIEHQHSYGIFVSINKFSHRRNCACGATQVSSHYISGTHVGEDWVPCAGCGYLLDMRDDIHEGIMSITQVSVNGSYIRSDGIVVLVDEDIEAYLAGTLQFYHPENVPVTQ